MKTLLSTIAAGSVLAASVLLACASSEDEPRAAVDADAATDATPDAAPPAVDAADAGATDSGLAQRPPFDAAPPEIACAVTPCMKSLVSGPKNYCATATDGVVRCWGDRPSLGAFVDGGDPNGGATPVALTGIGDVVAVGMSNEDTCIAPAGGGVQCFGRSSPTPKVVSSVGNVRSLAIGDDRKCAVLASGELACWGTSYSTGMGEETTNLGEAVISASMQYSVGLALGAKGTLFSWGSDRYMLGRTSAISPDLTPAPVIGLPPALQMSASDYHVCAITADGRLFCWGRNDSGALGLGYVRTEWSPVEVVFPGPAWPAQIAAAQTHSCARMSDGTVTCWASNNRSGELGYPATQGVYIPTTVTSVKQEVVTVAVGDASTCALLKDGSVQCWGDNEVGQLGQSPRDSFRHPNPTTVVFP